MMMLRRRLARFVTLAVSGLLTAAVLATAACYVRGPHERLPPGRTARAAVAAMERPAPDMNTEAYDRIYDNPFLAARDNPLSTFSIDVDTASYANVRRFLHEERLPPPDAVRIEELVNYFRYTYPPPRGAEPLAVATEVGPCAWNPEHRLVRIGLRARTVVAGQAPARNLTFLIDVSGSMDDPRKLPLLKRSLALLALGCSRAPHARDSAWVTEAARRHALADERLEAGDGPAARDALRVVVSARVPDDVPVADRRGVLQDTYFRLARIELDARDPRAALVDAERGLALGTAPDLFVANLLVVRGAAHEALGQGPAAAEDYHRALVINDQLLTEALHEPANAPDASGGAP